MRLKRMTALILAVLMLVATVPVFNADINANEATGPDYYVENPYGTDPGDSVGLIPKSKVEAKDDDAEMITIPCKNLYIGIKNLYGVAEPTEEDIAKKQVTKRDLRRIWMLSPEKCVPHNQAECGVKVSRLYGLEYCDKLIKLSLPYQRVTDLEPLKNLTDLVFLNLKDNQYSGDAHDTEGLKGDKE